MIDATKGMVFYSWIEEEHEHEGAKNTIMNMILTIGSPHIVPKIVEPIRDRCGSLSR